MTASDNSLRPLDDDAEAEADALPPKVEEAAAAVAAATSLPYSPPEVADAAAEALAASKPWDLACSMEAVANVRQDRC